MCKDKKDVIQRIPEELWSRITVVTNRKLCYRPFLEQIEILCRERPERIILREKDLCPEDYEKLGQEVKKICDAYQVPCYYHTYGEAGLKAGVRGLHLPLPLLRQTGRKEEYREVLLGTSVHSLEEAREAQTLGADYLTAGHIYATDCKRGLPPRGTGFLREICQEVSLPVYAIGGIRLEEKQIEKTLACGARGVCIMSGAMTYQGLRH